MIKDNGWYCWCNKKVTKNLVSSRNELQLEMALRYAQLWLATLQRHRDKTKDETERLEIDFFIARITKLIRAQILLKLYNIK